MKENDAGRHAEACNEYRCCRQNPQRCDQRRRSKRWNLFIVVALLAFGLATTTVFAAVRDADSGVNAETQGTWQLASCGSEGCAAPAAEAKKACPADCTKSCCAAAEACGAEKACPADCTKPCCAEAQGAASENESCAAEKACCPAEKACCAAKKACCPAEKACCAAEKACPAGCTKSCCAEAQGAASEAEGADAEGAEAKGSCPYTQSPCGAKAGNASSGCVRGADANKCSIS
jgi:hypothetical protein